MSIISRKWGELDEAIRLLALRKLGPLAHLVGIWKGTGYAIISRPDAKNGQIFNFQQNPTIEELSFVPVISSVLNRTASQGEDDIILKGLVYEQLILDKSNPLNVLHFEIGQWLLVPDPTDELKLSIVRQANILHGVSFLAMGDAPGLAPALGKPDLEQLDTTPTGPPVDQDPKYLKQIDEAPLPLGIPEGSKKNPSLFLVHHIATQKIIDHVKFRLSAHLPKIDLQDQHHGIINIPFLDRNAQVTEVNATFYVEHIEDMSAPTQSSMQLQYAQRVILNFLGVDWPHVSVGTLSRLGL